MIVAGVDGCRGGWLCVVEDSDQVNACVKASFVALLESLSDDAVIAIDVPIGLTNCGPRGCDLEARRLLGRPRASSVFPAPVRAALPATRFEEACRLHHEADGRKLSKQAFGILPKIAEMDEVIRRRPTLQRRVREVHPEVCFAVWNGSPMAHRKTRTFGQNERERLIASVWPQFRSLREGLRGESFARDDLNDALAALWTARRIIEGRERVLPTQPEVDCFGLQMEIVA